MHIHFDWQEMMKVVIKITNDESSIYMTLLKVSYHMQMLDQFLQLGFIQLGLLQAIDFLFNSILLTNLFCISILVS
jgi:hypothetical protein